MSKKNPIEPNAPDPGDVSLEEEELRKRAIFDAMAPRRQKHILKRGYDNWEPFAEPKDPIDLRKDVTNRTTQTLVREFLQSLTDTEYSNSYAQGVLDLCLGIINDDERSKGMYDFSCWYRDLLKREAGE